MFKPFANNTDTLNINGDALVIANDTARLSLSGDLEIARDKTGLTTALALQNDTSLPTKLADEPPKPAGKTDNPFI